MNNTADSAVHSSTGGKNHLAADIYGLGHFGDKWIAALGNGCAQGRDESQVNLGALQKFMGLRASRNCGNGGQHNNCTEGYNDAFHRILHPAGPAEDSAVRGFRLVSRGVALALHARRGSAGARRTGCGGTVRVYHTLGVLSARSESCGACSKKAIVTNEGSGLHCHEDLAAPANGSFS